MVNAPPVVSADARTMSVVPLKVRRSGERTRLLGHDPSFR
jgi:hypothetical protein